MMNKEIDINSLIPEHNPAYFKRNEYDIISKVFKRKLFYPMYVTGPSGIGKTITILQACADAQLPLVRVNISIETDEDALMGGFRLINGETVFEKGPVIKAMEMGAILLLDEVDLGSPTRMMCLQSVMEPNGGYLIKKTGEYIKPKHGFNIIATANTKGIGDDTTGQYVGTQTMNEAALDRYKLTIQMDYPGIDEERNILNANCEFMGLKNSSTDIENLLKFADKIRQTIANENSIEHNISTRRLVAILETKDIFEVPLKKAIELCISRYDGHTKEAYMNAYDAMFVEEDTEEDTEEDDDYARLMKEISNLKPF